MTYGEIFIQVLSEVTGQSEEHVNDLLSKFRARHPGDNFDEEMPPEKAEAILKAARENPTAIMDWLVQGHALAMSKAGHA